MTDRFYQPPGHDQQEIKRMIVWLAIFFGALVLAAALIITFADKIAQALPFSAEKRFVKPYEAMANYWSDEDREPEHLQIESYLSNLSADIARHMQLPADHTLSIHYIDGEMVNAFATLGGHVFIFRGLLEALPDENSLSMVLAHEIAHIKHRDPLAGMGRGLALQLVISFLTGQNPGSSEIVLNGGEVGLLHFSREQEAAADSVALECLQRKYQHVGGFDKLFRQLAEELERQRAERDGGDTGTVMEREIDELESRLEQWLSSHPETNQRILHLERQADENGWPVIGESTPYPAWLTRHLAAEAVDATYPWPR